MTSGVFSRRAGMTLGGFITIERKLIITTLVLIYTYSMGFWNALSDKDQNKNVNYYFNCNNITISDICSTICNATKVNHTLY
jgi:hypothetical protein